jgi:hypothetical protein
MAQGYITTVQWLHDHGAALYNHCAAVHKHGAAIHNHGAGIHHHCAGIHVHGAAVTAPVQLFIPVHCCVLFKRTASNIIPFQRDVQCGTIKFTKLRVTTYVMHANYYYESPHPAPRCDKFSLFGSTFYIRGFLVIYGFTSPLYKPNGCIGALK